MVLLLLILPERPLPPIVMICYPNSGKPKSYSAATRDLRVDCFVTFPTLHFRSSSQWLLFERSRVEIWLFAKP